MGKGELKERMDLLAQEAERRKRLGQLRRSTLKKSLFLKKKAVINAKDVYNLVKEFFKDFLDQQYEFTISELRAELKKIYISNQTREKIHVVFDALHKIEYSHVTLSREELTAMLDAFDNVVQELVKTHGKKQSFFSRLRAFLFKEEIEPEIIISELPAIEDDSTTNVRIHTLIEKCYIALDTHRLSRAKGAYEALLLEYAKLSREEREEFYPLISQTHTDLMHRAKTHS